MLFELMALSEILSIQITSLAEMIVLLPGVPGWYQPIPRSGLLVPIAASYS